MWRRAPPSCAATSSAAWPRASTRCSAGWSTRAIFCSSVCADATSELLVRNAELEESYQRVLGLQEALARAERLAAVGEMAASVAHQVGTPFNLVSGYVQMVRDDPQTDPVGAPAPGDCRDASYGRSHTCFGRCSTRRGSRRPGSRPVWRRSSNVRVRSRVPGWPGPACSWTSSWKTRFPKSMPTRRSSSWRC